MRVIFLNRFYWPDEPATAQLLTDLAEELGGRGREVVVVASHPGTPQVEREQSHRGVRIIRVRTPRHLLPGLAGKVLAYATFYLGALWRTFWLVRPGDVLVALTDPPLIGLGAWMIAIVRHTRLIHWVQDIYPEVAIELAGQRWLRALIPVRNLAWRGADTCVVLGSDMAQVLTDAGISSRQLVRVPNWAPVGLLPQSPAVAENLRRTWGLDGKFVVAYSGNLGRVHDLEPVISVAAQLRHRPEIAFVFIGGGAQRTVLEQDVRQRGLTNVHFHPAQPRETLPVVLALGDVHLVTLLPGCERLVFPSKLYGVAAVGRPVIVIGPAGCELAAVVTREKFGQAFTRDQIEAIAAALVSLAQDPSMRQHLGASARDFSAAQQGAKTAADHWEKALARSALADSRDE